MSTVYEFAEQHKVEYNFLLYEHNPLIYSDNYKND